MSSGFESNPQIISLPVSADSSSNQYKLHAINSSGQAALATTRGQRVHGVLLDNPAAANRAGALAYQGVAQVSCGGTFEEGDELTTNASGLAIKADRAGDAVFGTAVEAGASGARASAIIGVGGAQRGDPQMIIVEDFENNYGATEDPAAIQVDGTAASGTAGEVNLLSLKESTWGYAALGTQTITVPVMITDAVNSLVGLNIGMDQTADDGVNIWTHYGPGVSGRPFVIGSDAAFYAQLKFSIADVSGTDDFHFGFRRAEIPNAAFDDYLDAAGFHVNGTTLNLETILNNAATTTTDTTDAMADAARTYTFKVLVSAAGVVTYQHDITTEGTLAAPTTTAAFTFDDGDPVIPFIFFLNHTDLAGEVPIHLWEVGYQ
jgi:hypothetical protein